MKNRNIILGDGDLANELVNFARMSAEDTKLVGRKEFNCLDFRKLGKDHKIYLAYSDPELKSRVAGVVRSHDLKVSSFIHETVIIGSNVKLGEGVICFPYTIVSNDANVGDLVFINCSCNVGHHVTIGNYSSIMGNSSISGRCEVGEANYFGTGSILTPKVTTPKGLRLGVGSVLVKTPKSSGTYHGNPASRLL